MPKKLLSLYVRVGTGAARLAFSVTSRAVKLAGSAVGFGGAGSEDASPWAGRESAGESGFTETRQPARDSEPSVEAPAAFEEEQGAVAIAEAELASRASAIDYDAEPPTPLDPAAELAKTLDDEPELVEELAEPGAEDGAGATIEVDEPWEGYAHLTADEVIARIEDMGAAELAVLELYEQMHRKRQTVLQAAERRHKAISGPASR